MMPHRKYGSQDTRNTVTVVNRTHLEVGKMGRVKFRKKASPVALHPVGGEGGGVEADAAGPQGGGGGAGEEGVVRHLLGLDGSLHLQCEVCSDPLVSVLTCWMVR